MKTNRHKLAAAFAIGSIATTVVMACSSDDDDVDHFGSCAEIARLCHPYDKVSAIGHECHELGHAGNDQACGPRRAECVAACPPTEAGASHPDDASVPVDERDAALVEAGPDAGEDEACVSYCACLTTTCQPVMGAQYPWASEEACRTGCRALTAPEKTCWSSFCESAKGLVDKGHACDHAAGSLGLDECN